MNILPLNVLNFNNHNSVQNNRFSQQNSQFGLKMARPLSADTVSFRATPKTLQKEALKNLLPRNVVQDIADIAAERQPKVNRFMQKWFGDLCCTKYNPDNLIYKLGDRPKSPDSINEKAATRNWHTKAEILSNATDLNGAKIVMRDGSRGPVGKILGRFEQAIKNGEVELVEIENKRPSVTEKMKGPDALKYDYATPDELERLKEVNEKKHPSKKVNFEPCDYTKTNYPGLHFLFKLPGEDWVFEVQIMGYDVALYKDLDDLLFKILDNKNADKKKYKPIIDIIKPLNEPGNAAIKEGFNKYRGNVFLFQREKAPHIRKNKQYIERFLPIKDEIQDGELRDLLDMNNLYELFIECNAKAAKKKPVHKN